MKGTKTERALAARRNAWESMPGSDKGGTKKPGSRNPKKGYTGQRNKRR